MSEEVKQEGTFKIKRKPKQLVKDNVIKVDLSKPKEETDAIQVGKTEEVAVEEQTGNSPKVDKQIPESKEVSKAKEESLIQEIVEEEDKTIEEKVEEDIVELGEKLEEKVIAPTPEAVSYTHLRAHET